HGHATGSARGPFNTRLRAVQARGAKEGVVMLSILNVGEGDTKLVFDKDKPEERARACRIVTNMLKRGFAILVAAGERDGRPLYYRAESFDPETAEYIVAGLPEDEPVPVLKEEEKPPARRRGRPAGSKGK